MRTSAKSAVLDLAVCALIAALMMAGAYVMSFLPNIEPVSLILAAFTLTFGLRRAMMSTGVYVLLEGLLYGFGLWFWSYLYVWPLWVLLVWLFRNQRSRVVWAVIAGGFGLCFGALCALPNLILLGVSGAFSYWISGIPFDLAHCAGNFVLALLLLPPLQKVLGQIHSRMIKN